MSQKNIVFDFGAVLVDWNPDYLYRSYFPNPEELKKFYERTKLLHWNEEFDRGEPILPVLQKLQDELPEYHEPIRAWYDEWPKMMGGAIEENVAILRQLKSAGFPLYGLTNWSGETFKHALEKFDFFELFLDIVVSGVEKTKKPEEKIYSILLERNSLKPEDCVFIDDRAENLATAERMSFQTILFQTPPDLSEGLKKFNINC